MELVISAKIAKIINKFPDCNYNGLLQVKNSIYVKITRIYANSNFEK